MSASGGSPATCHYAPGHTQAEAQTKFEADATEAAGFGWKPTARWWQDTTLTVAYQQYERATLPGEDAPARGDDDARPVAERPGTQPVVQPQEHLTQAEVAKAVEAGVSKVAEGLRAPSLAGVVLSVIAAIAFFLAGLQLMSIQSVAGNTIAEAFYNGVGVMCFGLAALSLAIGFRN